MCTKKKLHIIWVNNVKICVISNQAVIMKNSAKNVKIFNFVLRIHKMLAIQKINTWINKSDFVFQIHNMQVIKSCVHNIFLLCVISIQKTLQLMQIMQKVCKYLILCFEYMKCYYYFI